MPYTQQQQQKQQQPQQQQQANSNSECTFDTFWPKCDKNERRNRAAERERERERQRASAQQESNVVLLPAACKVSSGLLPARLPTSLHASLPACLPQLLFSFCCAFLLADNAFVPHSRQRNSIACCRRCSAVAAGVAAAKCEKCRKCNFLQVKCLPCAFGPHQLRGRITNDFTPNPAWLPGWLAACQLCPCLACSSAHACAPPATLQLK